MRRTPQRLEGELLRQSLSCLPVAPLRERRQLPRDPRAGNQRRQGRLEARQSGFSSFDKQSLVALLLKLARGLPTSRVSLRKLQG